MAIAAGCGGPAYLEKPNVILISLDTLRADHLPTYGYARPTAPSIAALHADAVVFESAYSQASHTLPSHASLMTGMPPPAHGVVSRSAAIAEDDSTLAELLRARGYRTAAFVNAAFLDRRYGFGRGFEVYDFAHDLDVARDAQATNSAALNWLRSIGDDPFFLFLHYFDIHSDWEKLPYDSPVEYRERLAGPMPEGFPLGEGQLWASRYLRLRMEQGLRYDKVSLNYLRSLYDAGIAYTDAQLGSFVAALRDLDLLDETLLVLVSDHGEEFEEHGKLLHGQVFEEIVRVPLLLMAPELRGSEYRACRSPDRSRRLGVEHRGLRIHAVVQLVDVLPTILACLGEDSPAQTYGRDLLGVITGSDTRETPAYFQTFGEGQFGMRRGRWKYVESGKRGRIFDLSRDPAESRDLAREQPNLVAEFSQELGRWRELASRRSQRREAVELEPEFRERLEALGYAE